MSLRDNLITLLEMEVPGGRLRLHLGGESSLYLQVTTGTDFEPDVSYAVIRKEWHTPVYTVTEEPGGLLVVQTSALKITVRTSPFHLKVEDLHGAVRFETTGEGLALDGPRIHLERVLGEREAVYGLGEHGESLNRNPGVYRIWNRDEPHHHPYKQYYCTIPMAVCAPGGAVGPHAFFIDNPGEVFVDVATRKHGALRMETRTGDLRLWLFFAPTPAELIRDYTDLTGRMERPPLWALGFQQCRWSYMSADRVREIARGFRTRRIPCDVVYMDIDYMQDYLVFTWNTKTFPEPLALLKELKAEGFSPLCIIDPGVGIRPGYFAYDEGLKQQGFFCRHLNGELFTGRVWQGEVHMPDFTNPETRTTWANWQQTHLLDLGIVGVWNDMNEPAIFGDSSGCKEFPADVVHHDFGLYRPHLRIHNTYGLTMAQTSCEGQLTSRPDQRHFTLTRSGWAGIQRYSAVWTGDNRSAFATMPLDLALNLNMGMSGVAFVGCDIGGFQGNATPELFSRWIEWGVFQPFCRAHSAAGTADHEPWVFGAATEWVARRLLELRYQLLPTIYTQFVEASETGMPVNRPLALAYPEDATGASIGDEFLLGPDILVAPVCEPGKDHRALYLPPGEWYHFWSERAYQGGRWVMVPAPYGQPPVFIRGGAVLPMWPIRQHTKGPEPEEMFLDVWPGSILSGELVEDDGTSRRYRQGEEARITFAGSETSKHLNLFIGEPHGPYRSGRKRWTVRLHRANRPVLSVRCNGKAIPFERDGSIFKWSVEDPRQQMEFLAEYGN